MTHYFDHMEQEVQVCYDIANKARSKGYDPVDTTEIPLARNMAERVVGLITIVAPQIKDTTVIQRIKELEEQHGALDWRVALTISLEVAQQKFCQFKDEKEAMEIGDDGCLDVDFGHAFSSRYTLIDGDSTGLPSASPSAR